MGSGIFSDCSPESLSYCPTSCLTVHALLVSRYVDELAAGVGRVYIRRTPGEWVWGTSGRHDKRRTRTGTRIVLDGIVMGSGVIAQEA